MTSPSDISMLQARCYTPSAGTWCSYNYNVPPPFQQTVYHTQPQPRGSLPRPKYANASLEAKYARGSHETPFPLGTCWTYQRGSECDGRCDWAHTHHCCYCKGNHPAVRCPDSKGSSEDRTNDRGGKGPSANRPKLAKVQ